MILELYSFRDVVVGQFSKPDMFVNREQAKRHFEIVKSKSDIAKDLQLYQVGTFNVETGEIVPLCDFVE